MGEGGVKRAEDDWKQDSAEREGGGKVGRGK